MPLSVYILLALPIFMIAQTNLIQNGSFEQVNKICEEYRLRYEWFNHALPNWDGVSGSGATICGK
ncbi:MAG: hypothetical protein ACI94Y_001854 [Maribacter sp.]|jgi:hypothetical protein